MMDNKELKRILKNKAAKIDAALERYLPRQGKLAKAMRHSLFAGGKRFRPILCLATARALGSSEDKVLPYACAVELAHTFTLIHDDLPAMDNADLRRGRPSCHKVYGEAVAILAGDALQALSARLAAPWPAAAEELSRALLQVVAGQVDDLFSSTEKMTLKKARQIHRWKTAALIRACVRGAGLICGASPRQLGALSAYAEHLGLAFQIADDILDVTATEKALGKPVGADGKKGFPFLIGLRRSREMARGEEAKAVAVLRGFGREAELLREIAGYVVKREK